MGRKKKIVNEEEIGEDLCFICKDGGHLRICDFKGCLKGYHYFCVEKDPSFLESDEPFICGWHSCSCSKDAVFKCLCCPISYCQGCIKCDEFVTIKSNTNGLCINCLKLAKLVEENKDVDSEGAKVDFQDRSTYEFLYKDYWIIVREKEKLTLEDLRAADATLKRRESCKSGSDTDDFLEEESMSEDEDENSPSRKKTRRVKTPAKRSRIKKKTYVGWASEELIGFLSSIGKYSKDPLSLFEISRIITQYIQENNLFDPNKKKKRKYVICNDTLRSLFRKSRMKIINIDELLEIHLASNGDLDDDFSFSSDEGDDQGATKKHQKKNSESKVRSEPSYRRKVLEQTKSQYAALGEKNINSLYMRKSLVLELLKDPDTFEDKVTGCFVRVKTDRKHFYYLPYKQYRLGLVKGIKKVAQEYMVGDTSTNVALCISNMEDILISMLSEDDIEEEEYEDLRELVTKDLFKRPTIAELEKKLENVHKDIMSHWIDRELLMLKPMIDRANEKGWRAELNELIDKREMLRKPEERERLLKEIPSVIADMEVDVACVSSDIASAPPNLHGGQESLLKEIEGGHGASLEAPLHKVEERHGAAPETPIPEAEGSKSTIPLSGPRASSSFPVQLDRRAAAQESSLPEVEDSVRKSTEDRAALVETTAQAVVEGIGASSSARGQLDTDQQRTMEANETNINKVDTKGEAKEVHLMDKMGSRIIIIDLDDDDDDSDAPNASRENLSFREASRIGVDEAANRRRESFSSREARCIGVEEAANRPNEWYYIDPTGEVQGPVTIEALRMWHGAKFFDVDFMVWRAGQSPNEAILLTKVLGLSM